MQAAPSLNGHARKPAARSRKFAVPKPVPAARPDHLRAYAIAGVATMSILSAGLNGYAHAQHATVAWAGWTLGIVIPAIILILGRVAGTLWHRNKRPIAYLAAGAGVGLLALSVWHCTASIALLTGSPLLLAAPMAVAIDLGFVACELATIEAEKDRK